MTYEAETDLPTIANLCQHSYFNLDGGASTLNHDIMIAADHYLPTNERQVPTGEVAPVDGTAFDLREMTSMKRQSEGEKILYDHNFCLSRERQVKRSVAFVRSVDSGVSLEVRTTEPGVQFYTGWKLNVPVPASKTAPTRPSPASAWKPRPGPTPSTTKASPRPCCARARCCGRKRIMCSCGAEGEARACGDTIARNR